MYNVSEQYLSAVRAYEKTDRLTGTLKLTDGTETTLEDKDFSEGGFSLTRSVVSGEELEFGSAILSELEIALRTEQSRYVFYGAKITLNYGVQLSDGTWFDVPLGTFTVAEAERDQNLVEMVAYDNLWDLDDEYDGTALYGTPFVILTAICNICGMTLANTEEEITAMTNGEETIQIGGDSGCKTYRDCVKVVAQLLAAFAVADRNGNLLIRQYGKTSVATFEKKDRTSLTAADYVCQYSGVRIQSSSKIFDSYNVDIMTGLELTIQDAPAWDYGLDETLQARTDAVLAELVQLPYTPMKAVLFSDPALDCGDRVEFVTDTGTITTLITGYTWEYHGKMNVESTGKNPYLSAQKTQIISIVRDLQYQTTNNKLIFYSFSNASALTVSGSEPKEIAKLTFTTVEQTSAMFIAQIPVETTAEDTETTTTTETEKTVTVKDSTGAQTTITDASGNALTLTVMDSDTTTKVTPGYADLEIQYYLNGNLVDYQLIQRLYKGPHLLSLFYPFADLAAKTVTTLSVRMRLVDGGSIAIAERAIRATVTGQGLAATTEWDGTLSFEEYVPQISLVSRLVLASASEEVTAETQVPTASSIEETVSGFTLRSRLALAAVTDEPGVNPVWEQQTISSASLTKWEYQSRYVTLTDSGVQLKTAWNYQSAEQAIDTGRMTVVKAVTSDLASVESLEVEEDG